MRRPWRVPTVIWSEGEPKGVPGLTASSTWRSGMLYSPLPPMIPNSTSFIGVSFGDLSVVNAAHAAFLNRSLQLVAGSASGASGPPAALPTSGKLCQLPLFRFEFSLQLHDMPGGHLLQLLALHTRCGYLVSQLCQFRRLPV